MPATHKCSEQAAAVNCPQSACCSCDIWLHSNILQVGSKGTVKSTRQNFQIIGCQISRGMAVKVHKRLLGKVQLGLNASGLLSCQTHDGRHSDEPLF